MESDLTPEQLEIAAEILGGGVTAEDVARFMLPADAPGRLLPAPLIRAEQKVIRDAVQRREWWAKLRAAGAAPSGAWDVRPPDLAGGAVQGEPWHFDAPPAPRGDHHPAFANVTMEEPDLPEWALRDIAAKLDAEDEADQAWMDEVVKLPEERTNSYAFHSYNPATGKYEQPYTPNRAERRRLTREERRRGRLD